MYNSGRILLNCGFWESAWQKSSDLIFPDLDTIQNFSIHALKLLLNLQHLSRSYKEQASSVSISHINVNSACSCYSCLISVWISAQLAVWDHPVLSQIFLQSQHYQVCEASHLCQSPDPETEIGFWLSFSTLILIFSVPHCQVGHWHESRWIHD